MCIDGIADPGDNILIPRPGFSLYVTLCQSLGIEARFYNLIVNKNFSRKIFFQCYLFSPMIIGELI
jgi:aspartate/methionine/tyrosine aminotransferase